MHGGTRANAGRPELWKRNSYSTSLMRLPEELKEALLNARTEQIPVSQMVQSLKTIQTDTFSNNGLFYK